MVVLGIDRRRFVANLAPIRIELIGEQHRQSGINTLPHFRVIHDNSDSFISADTQERIGHEGTF